MILPSNIGVYASAFKVAAAGGGGDNVKSFFIDIADNYGSGSFVGVRSIDFFFGGNLIPLLPSDFSSDATSELSSKFVSANAFNTSLSKVSGATNQSFVADDTNSQRLICVFNTPITFDQVVINNYHSKGSSTNIGMQNIVVHSSIDTISDNAYNGAMTNEILLFSGVLAEHVNSNVQDDQVIFTS